MHLYAFLFSDVQFKKKVKEQDLSKTIHSFIKASESGARKSVYFAYLVGPTVQVCSFLLKIFQIPYKLDFHFFHLFRWHDFGDLFYVN